MMGLRAVEVNRNGVPEEYGSIVKWSFMTLMKGSEWLPGKVDLGRRRAVEDTERIHYCSKRETKVKSRSACVTVKN